MDTLGREEDCGEGCNEDKAGHYSLATLLAFDHVFSWRYTYVAISEALRNPPVDEQANDFAAVRAVRESSLPPRWYLVRSIGSEHAILLVELWETVEIVDQADVTRER